MHDSPIGPRTSCYRETLDAVTWKPARIARDVEEINRLKQQPGKNIHAVGDAALVSSLLNEDLIDEIRLTVHPLVLGQGKPLFKDVRDRQALDLVGRPESFDRKR